MHAAPCMASAALGPHAPAGGGPHVAAAPMHAHAQHPQTPQHVAIAARLGAAVIIGHACSAASAARGAAVRAAMAARRACMVRAPAACIDHAGSRPCAAHAMRGAMRDACAWPSCAAMHMGRSACSCMAVAPTCTRSAVADEPHQLTVAHRSCACMQRHAASQHARLSIARGHTRHARLLQWRMLWHRSAVAAVDH